MNDMPDHRTSIVTLAGPSPAEMVLLATLMPPIDEPEDNWSLVMKLSHGDSFKGEKLYLVHEWLTAMSRSPGGRLFAVSIKGRLHFTQGANWTVRDLGCPNGLMCAWAADDDDLFAGGFRGERVRLRGNTLTVVRDDQQRTLNAIHGSAADNVYAVGNEGAIVRFDGNQWIELDSPTNYPLHAVLCRSKTEIYVGGRDGVLYRSNGVDWDRLPCSKILISSLAWYQETLYAAAGPDGVWRLTTKGMGKAKDRPFYELQRVQDYLYGIVTTLVARFDGQSWVGGHLDI